MSIVFAGFIGAVIAFLILFKRTSLLRNVIAFVIAAIVTGLLIGVTFQALYPMHSPGWARNYTFYWTWGVLMAVLAPIVGIVAAMLWRKRAT